MTMDHFLSEDHTFPMIPAHKAMDTPAHTPIASSCLWIKSIDHAAYMRPAVPIVPAIPIRDHLGIPAYPFR